MNGSRKSDIHAITTDLNAICEIEGIILSPEWIPREGNEKADYLSRCQDSDDWEISSQIFNYLDSIWGPYTIDRFASHLRTGWSGGAMVLGKLPMPGRPAYLD